MMRRRFGRRRWGGGGGDGEGEGPRGLDANRELTRVIQSGVVPAEALEPVEGGEVPATLAVVGTGVSRDGERLVVGVSPASGGDAWLAALAVAARRVQEEGFDGAVYAVSGSWSLAARRRLGLLRPGPLRVRARIEPDAQDAVGEVTAEGLESPVLPVSSLPAELGESARVLWRRAATALAGLGAKHGGAVRPAPGGIELVFAGRAIAILRGDALGVALEAWEPRRELQRLAPDALADAFDRFEGSLRKALGDRRLREGEPALRAALAARLAESAGVRALAPWPLAGPLGEGIDFAGVDGHGRTVVGVARPELGLLALGAALDGWIELVPRVASLLPEAPAPSSAKPLLLLAAERFDAAVERVLTCLDVEVRTWSAESAGRGEPTLVPRTPPARLAAGTGRAPLAPARPGGMEARPAPPPRPSPAAETPLPLRPAAPIVEAGTQAEASEEAAPRRRFEEVSLFDLAGEGDEPGDRGGPRRRRRRRRGRGRSRAGGAEGALRPDDEERGDEDDESEPALADDEGAAEPASGAREERDEREREEHGDRSSRRGRRRGRGRGRDRDRERERPRDERARPAPALAREEAEGGEDDEDLEDEELVALAEVPDVTEIEEPAAEAGFDDEEEEEESPEEARLRQEREARRRARIAKVEPEVAPPPRPPRRRAAFLAHADRESIGAAVLLARETRLVEGIWVYPQADLMTFFRGVTTDLRDDTPICVIGFTASPARDSLQAASLYRDRLTWFDHHDWPPEDVERLRGAIGADAVHVEPGAGSVLPLVLATCARRSRFSDKLVDLLTGRFTRHDWERWGRLWWWRLGQVAGKTGERRAELEPLIGGRPSDLAREASRAADPPLPAEAEWAASRDFRLVHFGGYALVRVPVPPELDLHLAARIVRERYAAALSVAWSEGGEIFTLGSDEGASRRAFDLAAMVEHLAEKFAWVRPLADGDHVARLRIEGAAAQPGRIDEVVGEIAMGRSILEG
jgi:hypothetical protein